MYEQLGGNPHARYSDCCRCRLRVRYWPKHHATSHTMNNISPTAVRAILQGLRDRGVWEEMTWKDFLRQTQLYDAHLKADGQVITGQVKRDRKATAEHEKAAKAEAKAKAQAKAKPAAVRPAPTTASASASSQAMPEPTAPPQPVGPPTQGQPASDPFAGRTSSPPR